MSTESIKKTACNWPSCVQSFKDSWFVDRHCYQIHWPWYVSPLICVYCNRGFNQYSVFDEHIKTDKHLHTYNEVKEGNAATINIEEERSAWITRSFNSGLINCRQFHKLCKDQIHADTVMMETQPRAEADDSERLGVTQQIIKTESDYVNDPSMEPHSSNVIITHQDTTAIDVKVFQSSNITQSLASQESRNTTVPLSIHKRRYPSPVRDDPLADDENTSTSKRTCTRNQMRDAKTTEEKMEVLMDAIEQTNQRLDELERNLKLKMVETNEGLSRHIINEMRQTLSADRYTTQKYMKDLFEVLSEELRERDGM